MAADLSLSLLSGQSPHSPSRARAEAALDDVEAVATGVFAAGVSHAASVEHAVLVALEHDVDDAVTTHQLAARVVEVGNRFRLQMTRCDEDLPADDGRSGMALRPRTVHPPPFLETAP